MHNQIKFLIFAEKSSNMTFKLNPFIVSGIIPDQYFCDRKEESAILEKSLANQMNVVITSPRRMGKTSLINHVIRQTLFQKDYHIISIDILHTTSLKEFVQTLGMAVFSTLARQSEKLMKLFMTTLRSLSGSFGYDTMLGTPSFDVKLGDINNPDFTLNEIFDYLQKSDKPCIVVIDEFQQITNYAEKNIEALLRGHIQKNGNSNFVFSGSKRRIMEDMFLSSNRPFYQSAKILELNAISQEEYRSFAKHLFKINGKVLDDDAFNTIYENYRGVTYYVQRIMKECFAATLSEGRCDRELAETTSRLFVEENSPRLRELLSHLSEPQKALLYAIQSEGKAREITSSAFIKRHKLASASSVQAAMKHLLNYDVVTRTENTYFISDPLLDIWMKR